MTPKLTEAQVKALRWFAKQTGPISLFVRTAPTNAMRNKLIEARVVHVLPRTERVGFLKYEITPHGRAALAAIDGVQP